MSKKSLFLSLFIFAEVLIFAQPEYKISYQQIFDNREYFTDYAFAQTIFASRLNANLLFQLDTNHQFTGGLNYMYEMGGKPLSISPQVNISYAYASEKIHFNIGSFAREDKLMLQHAFLRDTLSYYRPNIDGALFSYKGSSLEITTFVDWVSRVSEFEREQFLFGLDGKYFWGSFYIAPSFLMFHNAKSYSVSDTIHIQDNGIMSLLAGYAYANTEGGFATDFSAGYMSSYNRFRPNKYNWSGGFFAELELKYNFFEFNAVYYKGGAVDFCYGDPFYKSGNYLRSDFYILPFRNEKIKSKAGWNLHYLPGEGWFNSQQLLLYIEF